MVWAKAWVRPSLPTLVPPFGPGRRKRAQGFRRRKHVVFGRRAAWVRDVPPVSEHARGVLTPSAVAVCRSVTLPDGCPKPLGVCRACSVRASTSCLRVPCWCSKRCLHAGRGTSSTRAKAQCASSARAQNTGQTAVNPTTYVVVDPCSANALHVHQFGGRNATCATIVGHVPV